MIIGANNGQSVRVRSNFLYFDAQGGSAPIAFTSNGGSVTWGLETILNPTNSATFRIVHTLTTTSAHNVFDLPTTVNSTSVGNLTVFNPAFTFTDWDGDVIGYNWNPTTPANIAGTHYAIRAVSGGVVFGHTALTTATTRLQIRGTNNATALLVEDDSGNMIANFGESGGARVMGYFGATPVAQQAGLTAFTHTAPGTPDYTIQDLVVATGFGFVTKDEGNTVLSIVKAMHDAMKNYGLLT